MLSRRERRRWDKPRGHSRLGNETRFRFRATNSSINILTNPIKGLATRGILASSLPSPDCNHFGAHIKLSNKKALLLTPFNVLDFSRLPSHNYALLLPFLKWITAFLPLSLPLFLPVPCRVIHGVHSLWVTMPLSFRQEKWNSTGKHNPVRY